VLNPSAPVNTVFCLVFGLYVFDAAAAVSAVDAWPVVGASGLGAGAGDSLLLLPPNNLLTNDAMSLPPYKVIAERDHAGDHQDR